MLTSKNLRKVTFTAFVQEEEASIIEHELNSLYQRSEATLACGDVVVETCNIREDFGLASALTFFNDLVEES